MYCEKEKECPIYQIHREMVTGKSEELEKRELLIGAPKEEKQGGKKR